VKNVSRLSLAHNAFRELSIPENLSGIFLNHQMS
jgi:hypothetical protein